MKNKQELVKGITYCRDIDGLSFREIGERYKLPSSKILILYKEREDIWLDGLSHRAKNQLKRTCYKDYKTLYNDVTFNQVDLEDYPWIGHKVAQEIIRWLKPVVDRRKHERRNDRR